MIHIYFLGLTSYLQQVGLHKVVSIIVSCADGSLVTTLILSSVGSCNSTVLIAEGISVSMWLQNVSQAHL